MISAVGTEETVYNIYMKGMESAIADPTDIVKNWDLDGHWQTHSDGAGRNWLHSFEQIREGKKV